MDAKANSKLVQTLRSLYRGNDAARKLLDTMAERKQDRLETAVERAATLAGISTSEAGDILRQLAEDGAGQLLLGRHGYKTRMAWAYSQRSLGEIARGATDVPEPVDQNAAREPKVGEKDLPPEGIVSHSFQLRPDLKIELRLPEDFSMRDAERLAGLLRLIPFEN